MFLVRSDPHSVCMGRRHCGLGVRVSVCHLFAHSSAALGRQWLFLKLVRAQFETDETTLTARLLRKLFDFKCRRSVHVDLLNDYVALTSIKVVHQLQWKTCLALTIVLADQHNRMNGFYEVVLTKIKGSYTMDWLNRPSFRGEWTDCVKDLILFYEEKGEGRSLGGGGSAVLVHEWRGMRRWINRKSFWSRSALAFVLLLLRFSRCFGCQAHWRNDPRPAWNPIRLADEKDIQYKLILSKRKNNFFTFTCHQGSLKPMTNCMFLLWFRFRQKMHYFAKIAIFSFERK